ncbi:MAG: helix-turn-helix domain-containing protein [Carbonactinosporaceae bacterium]
MTSADVPAIGQRLRELRRWRRLSQRVLGDRAGLSASFLSMVENGERSLERRSHLAALAAALEVSVTDLTGEPYPIVRPGVSGAQERVPAIRDVLLNHSLDDPPDIPARPLDVLETQVRGPILHAWRAANFSELTSWLPAVLGELHVHAAASEEHTRVRGLRLLVEAAQTTGSCLKYLGHVDLAWIAAERAGQAAAALGDPVQIGAATFARAHARPSASHARRLTMAATAADNLQPHLGGDVLAHQVYGMLQLSAALAAVIRGDTHAAEGHAVEAGEVADRVGARPDAWQSFGPANVAVWRVLLAVEAGDSAAALEHAGKLRPAAIPSQVRRSAFFIEYGRAYAMHGGHDEPAVMMLRRAERLSPDRVHHNVLVRELVSGMRARARRDAGGRELRGLAERMGVA